MRGFSSNRMIVILLLITAVLTLSSCTRASGSVSINGQVPTPVTLKFMLFGDKPTDMDKVLSEFEEKTKNTLNTKLDMEWNTAMEHKQKAKLKLTAGEEVDALYDASWMSLYENASLGYYRVLDSYFNNDDYPGLKKAFSDEFLEANKINGHLYAIPITGAYYDLPVIYIRKDLRVKYGLGPIKSYEELEVYLQKVQEHNPELIPLGLKGDRGFYQMFMSEERLTALRAEPHAITGTGAIFNVVLSEDGRKVLGAVTVGDPAQEYQNLPKPYNNPDYFYSLYDKYVQWNSYIQQDVLNEKDNLLLLTSGQTAATEGTASGFTQWAQKLKATVRDAELEFFVYNKKMQSQEEGAIPTDFRAWNNIAIPASSQNVERTMRFLDWLFLTPENHDLIELGIEDEHWMKVGERGYKTTSKSVNYVFPGFQLTWNSQLSRENVRNSPEVQDVNGYLAKRESYYRIPLAGFNFNAATVKKEVAMVQSKFTEMRMLLQGGLDPNWRETAKQLNKELRIAGLNVIREELIEQVQAYLDAGGN